VILSRLNGKCLRTLYIRYYGVRVVRFCFLWGQRHSDLQSRDSLLSIDDTDPYSSKEGVYRAPRMWLRVLAEVLTIEEPRKQSDTSASQWTSVLDERPNSGTPIAGREAGKVQDTGTLS